MSELVETAPARALLRTSDRAERPLPVMRSEAAERERLARGLTRLRSLALWMDDRFELPIVKVRFGLDPLIGLIPAWGDWITWAVSSYILVEAIRLGLPMRKMFAMALHVALDLITGYVPGVGDLIDVAYKANRRNVNIVLEHFGAEPIRFGDRPASTPGVSSSSGVSSDEPAASASTDGHELISLPADALQRRTSTLSRWLVGGGMLLALAALAAIPFLLLWRLLQSS